MADAPGVLYFFRGVARTIELAFFVLLYEVADSMKKETLTSRQRVMRAINREPVDRVPIDLGSHMSTGISAFAYRNLRKYLGLPIQNIWIPDLVQMLAYVDEDIRSLFHVDCILLEPPWPQLRQWNFDGGFRFSVPHTFKPARDPEGGWVVRQGKDSMRMPAGAYFFDGDWLADWGEGSEEERIRLYAELAERIFKETFYATNFVGYSRGIGHGNFFEGIEQGVRMITAPEDVLAENERKCRAAISKFQKVNRTMGKYIQLITLGDDMGGQGGPLCNPEHIECFCIPFYKRFCSFVHDNSEIKVFMHNCGAIRPIIPMLIEAGIDVLNPVQISAADMEPAGLVAEFGDRITFWGGGCDTQNVLGSASPQEVADHVRGLVKTFKRGKGFVFNQIHNIQANVPPENIVAMLEAAYQESFY